MADTYQSIGIGDEKCSPIVLEKLTDLQSSVTDLQNKVDFFTGEVVALKIDASRSGEQLDPESGDENGVRGNWSSRLEYLLSTLGCVVGLSNLWRFPYLCYKHGGGAFLVPYCVFLVLLGAPMFLLESALGQFTSRGPLGCWQFAPIFKGVGVAMLLVSALVSIYYSMLIGWSVYYLFASFTTELPWARCGDWSSQVCVNSTAPVTRTWVDCTGSNSSGNEMCYYTNQTADGMLNKILGNATLDNATFGNAALGNGIFLLGRSSAEEYLERVVFGLTSTSTLDDVGILRWEMVLCSLLVWVVVYFSLISGIKSSGKVVYVTATLPYLMFVILLVRGVTLPGYMKGINAYISPNVERLMDPRVWKDAAGQVFFSMWVSWGGLITLASYNRFHNDIVRDTIMMTVANGVTSLFAGFVVYAYLGYMSEQLGVGIEDVAKQAWTLVFVVLPSAVAAMPTPTVWAVFFFVTLITLGLDNQFVLVETVVTSLCDQFPNSRPYRSLTTLVYCLALFLLGLTLCTNSGALWFELMDHCLAGWSVLIIALVECVALSYIYGARRFALDMEVMLGRGVCGCCSWTVCRLWWTFAWFLVAPVIMLLLLGMMLWDYKMLVFKYTDFPSWAAALGWLMTLCVVAAIVFGALIVCVCTKGSCAEKTRALFRPRRQWGPALIQHRKLVMHSDIVVDPSGNPQQGPTPNGVMLISKTDKYNPNQGVTNPIYDHAASSYLSAEDPSIFIIPEINGTSQKPSSANNAPNETSTPRL